MPTEACSGCRAYNRTESRCSAGGISVRILAPNRGVGRVQCTGDSPRARRASRTSFCPSQAAEAACILGHLPVGSPADRCCRPGMTDPVIPTFMLSVGRYWTAAATCGADLRASELRARREQCRDCWCSAISRSDRPPSSVGAEHTRIRVEAEVAPGSSRTPSKLPEHGEAPWRRIVLAPAPGGLRPALLDLGPPDVEGRSLRRRRAAPRRAADAPRVARPPAAPELCRSRACRRAGTAASPPQHELPLPRPPPAVRSPACRDRSTAGWRAVEPLTW
jgi:hypothetical protein